MFEQFRDLKMIEDECRKSEALYEACSLRTPGHEGAGLYCALDSIAIQAFFSLSGLDANATLGVWPRHPEHEPRL